MHYRAEPLSQQAVPVIGASTLRSIEHSACLIVSGGRDQTIYSFSLSGTVSLFAIGINRSWSGNLDVFTPDLVRFAS
jgi:hypothetical protein